jgi:carbon storage regulator CsrA
MLVLTRKSQESVVVGGSDGFTHLLKVTVLEVKGGSVRLGFEIDACVPVHRWEVWERIHAIDRPASDLASQRTPPPEATSPG